MRVTKTLPMIRGRRYRFTREDNCGNPVFGDNGQVVSSGIISVAFTSVSNSSDEIRVVNSNGDTCILEQGTTSLEGYSADVSFCAMDPDIFEISTGMPVIYDKNDVAVGVAVDTAVDTKNFAFGLEIWTGLSTDEACGEVGDEEFGYILTPYMKGGTLGDFTVENGAINFTVTGATSRKGGSWGRGPHRVVEQLAGNFAGPLLQPLTSTQVLVVMRTNVAPPAASDGGRPLLDPKDTSLTSIQAIIDELSVDFGVTPNTAFDEGVWYEFGDGTWEYVVSENGDHTHVYEEPGTYEVSASVNGRWVTTVLTVTDGS